MVNIVRSGSSDTFLGPRANKLLTFHDEQVDLIALPRERTTVMRPCGQKTIDVASIHVFRIALVYALYKQRPPMDGKSLNPKRQIAE
jgi:hypothetical protein